MSNVEEQLRFRLRHYEEQHAIAAAENCQLREQLKELSQRVKALENPAEANRLWVVQKLHRAFQEARKRAKRSGIEFTATLQDIDQLLESSPEHCSLTGLKFRPKENKHFRNPFAPSIDRINSAVGYVPGNLRIVAYCVNCAMNEWGLETFHEMCSAYAERHSE
jgi:hypothetical protein